MREIRSWELSAGSFQHAEIPEAGIRIGQGVGRLRVPLLRGKRAGQRNGLLIDGARRFDSSEARQHGAFLDMHRRHMEEGLTVGWLRCQGAEDLKRFAVAPERPYEIAFPRQRFSHRNMMQGGPRS